MTQPGHSVFPHAATHEAGGSDPVAGGPARSALYLWNPGGDEILGDGLAHTPTLVLDGPDAPNGDALVGTGITYNAGTKTITFATDGRYAVTVFAQFDEGADGGTLSSGFIDQENSDDLPSVASAAGLSQVVGSFYAMATQVRYFVAGTTLIVKCRLLATDITKHIATGVWCFIESV